MEYNANMADENRSWRLRPGVYEFDPGDLDLQEASVPDEIVKTEIVDFLESVPGGALVLEAAAGAGVESAVIESTGRKVVPADLSESLLKQMKENAEAVGVTSHLERRTQADIFHLPYKDDSFDAIVCKDIISLGFWTERSSILAELKRVLKPGGKALILAEELLPTIIRVNGQTREGREAELLGELKEEDDIQLIQLEFDEQHLRDITNEADFSGQDIRVLDKKTSRWASRKMLEARLTK